MQTSTINRESSRLSWLVFSLATCLAATTLTTAASAVEIQENWHYILKKPADNWTAADFDDANWRTGKGGFGTRGTPGARINTRWQTRDIWLRKTFELKTIPEHPALLIHHDDNATIYANGQQIADLPEWTTEYQVVPLDDKAKAALKVGQNLLAVHCHDNGGDQFIDVHVIDGKDVPELDWPPAPTEPFLTQLTTTWGEKVTADNAWTEYPRPQLVRDDWQNLNGQWDYALSTDETQHAPAKWDGKILVPFCLESKLGGVKKLLAPNQALWYHRTFKAQPEEGQRTLLNFEAVDYECKVLVNGKEVGQHRGGNTPFSCDITDAVKAGANELIVRVEDETGGYQLRGKQVLDPSGIWYTRVSGIWQTVWLEQVPAGYISDLKIATDAANGSITVKPIIAGAANGATFKVAVFDGKQPVAAASASGDSLTLKIADAKLWSPDSPQLYNLTVSLLDNAGKVLDEVQSYTGLRDVGKVKDSDGYWRFTLNGQPIFHWGTLDQGWWPDGLLTPPSDAALRSDVEFLKAAGFNMVRKHIKVEPRRFYYHCDQLGIMVWQDQVSARKSPPWTRLRPNPKDADWPDAAHEQYLQELDWMISELENHPSIVVWVPFNEAWGQHRTVEVGHWTSQRDPSRLVNIASGGNFWPAGDIVDAHSYPHPGFPFRQGANGRFDDYIKVVGEFGGHGYPVRDHLYDAEMRNWGYGGLPKNKEEYQQRYVQSLKILADLQKKGIAGGVYTQTTDVEGEINGLLTYDRRVTKIPAAELAELHKVLFTE